MTQQMRSREQGVFGCEAEHLKGGRQHRGQQKRMASEMEKGNVVVMYHTGS